jgi:hypothetical protein
MKNTNLPLKIVIITLIPWIERLRRQLSSRWTAPSVKSIKNQRDPFFCTLQLFLFSFLFFLGTQKKFWKQKWISCKLKITAWARNVKRVICMLAWLGPWRLTLLSGEPTPVSTFFLSFILTDFFGLRVHSGLIIKCIGWL